MFVPVTFFKPFNYFLHLVFTINFHKNNIGKTIERFMFVITIVKI
nr:MAG TPA: hypothetical protein [Caudoviricetes sp.]